MIKLSEYVFKYIAGLNIKDVFLLPGGGCMHLVDSLGANRKLKYTTVLHEQAAAIAADAYSQYSGKLGVVLVTTGPGGTNTLTGVAASWIDSTPVLYISGQAKRQDLLKGKGVRQMGVQEVDVVTLIKPITKYAVTVMDPLTIRYHLEKAVSLATTGRKGPVWVEIPLDVQGSMIEERRLEGWRVGGLAKNKFEIKKKITQILKLIKEAKRPVILAGNGIRSAGSEKEFVKLAEKLKIPVLLTWRAADFMPENHPLYFGRPGAVGQRAANFIQQNADLLITIGARLDLPQTAFSHDNFAKNAKKIIIDIDRKEIEKLGFKVDVAVIGDAGEFIKAITKVEILSTKRNVEKERWIGWCRKLKEKYPVPEVGSLKTGSKYVNTYKFIGALSDVLSGKEVLVPGSSGSCAEVTMQTVKVKKGLRILNTPGLGSMGFGLPASIGAAIASRKKTITIIGDGGLQHNIQELQTVKRLGLPLKIIVLNNNGYGSIKQMQNRHFKGRLVGCDPSSGLTLPNLNKVALAYGIKYSAIYDNKNLKSGIIKMLAGKGPAICEVFVDPLQETMPRISSRVMPDGKIISLPMEDLYPFLDREEFKRNMIVKTMEE